MMNRNTTPTEAAEQVALFQWAELMSGKYPVLRKMYAIPNGGSRHILEAVNLKKQGVKRGVPDVFLPVARKEFHGLYIEMKRLKGGKASEDQMKYFVDLVFEGYRVVLCKGWIEAKEVIEEYLTVK